MKRCPSCNTEVKVCYKFCPECGVEFPNETGPVRAVIYLHNDSDDGYEYGRELGLEGTALEEFPSLCYELAVVVEVNRETGDGVMIGINEHKPGDQGQPTLVKLKRPVKV